MPNPDGCATTAGMAVRCWSARDRPAAAPGEAGSPVAKAASETWPRWRGGLASTRVGRERIAHMAGIRVLATGGIGGVHRGAATSFDVSSDIDELAATPVAVICSGAKSILDLPATFELLETRRVPVVGLGTDVLPAFYSASSGLALVHRVDSAADAGAVIAAHLALPGAGGMLLVQPPPADVALDGAEVRAGSRTHWHGEGRGVPARVTTLVLAHGQRLTAGESCANIGLIVNNARMAGAIAVALASRRSS